MTAPAQTPATNRLRWLRNRFVMVPLLLLAVTAGWNAWVFTHDHGVVAGRVVDAAGAPVAGATVHLWVFNFATFVEKAATTTAADGSFRFTGNPSHNIQISADKADIGYSERIPVRLYFAAEDTTLVQPLKLGKRG